MVHSKLDSFYQHHNHLYRGGGWGQWGTTNWWVTEDLSNFQGEMAASSH